MKPVTRVLFVSLVASLLIGLTVVSDQPVWASAGTQVPDPGALLGVNPSAPGKKVIGTLSIFYTVVSESSSTCADFGGVEVDMRVAMRAKRADAAELRSEGEVIRGQCYFNLTAQRNAILSLIGSQLLPKLFPNGFTSFAAKDVDNLVQDENGQGTTDADPFFMMTDFTLGVVPK